MTALISSELLKLRTARSFVVLCGLGFAVSVLIAVASAILTDYSPDDPAPGLDQISNSTTVLFFTLMLGTLSVTTEFRHGSIAATLLVEPDRRRLVVAKLAAALGACALLALLTVAACLAIGGAILSSRDISLDLGAGEIVKLVAGVTVAGALTAGIGVGIGALVRKQTAAIVGIIVYILLIEPVFTEVLLPSLKHYAIGNAMTEVTGTGPVNGLADPLGQVAGGLVLLGWAAALAVIGALVIQGSDVTD